MVYRDFLDPAEVDGISAFCVPATDVLADVERFIAVAGEAVIDSELAGSTASLTEEFELGCLDVINLVGRFVVTQDFDEAQAAVQEFDPAVICGSIEGGSS